MKKNAEAIVIGAGSMGMAAGYYLAKQGVKTVLIDAFDPPHTMGSHHGDTRIIRQAYSGKKEYVTLASKALNIWREVEKEVGFTLFQSTGLLGVGYPESTFISSSIGNAQESDIPIEILQAEEIQKRWPGITIPEDFFGFFEREAGVLFSENCIRAYKQLALDQGASLLTNTRVKQVHIHSDHVLVETEDSTISADKLVLSAGAWTSQLLDALKLPLQPVRKTVAWFDADPTLYSHHLFPAFIFSLSGEEYYGFPSFDGCGVKVGRHDTGEKINPDHLDRTFGLYPQDTREPQHFFQKYMPAVSKTCLQGKVCIYTLTPDEDFIIDVHPEHSHIIIAAGFSGHGFKFSSAVGELLSHLALHGKNNVDLDLSIFSTSRFF